MYCATMYYQPRVLMFLLNLCTVVVKIAELKIYETYETWVKFKKMENRKYQKLKNTLNDV